MEGLFKDTMVNMKWTEIADSVKEKALVLLPLGVVEEHGPHLCLGTDIYIAHQQCLFIKEKLANAGVKAIIAPPFYFGICQATGSFIGSFKARKETVVAMLFDIMASLAEFGFQSVYGVNAHGDIEHSIAMIEAFKDATNQLPLRACYTFDAERMHHYGLNGAEPFICPIPRQEIQVSISKTPDVHGGDMETAFMNYFYPELTDTEVAKALPPVSVGDALIMTWLFGGHTKELSEDGYLGAPADYEGVEVLKHFNDVGERIAKAIIVKEGLGEKK